MKYLRYSLVCFGFLLSHGCGSTRSVKSGENVTATQIESRNKAFIPLINQIRRLPGIILENGVPIFLKGSNSIQDTGRSEPLYVIDGMAFGNSFRQIQDIVQPVDVASIKALSGADASFYGSRGASGVILITTRRGE